jgi:hypothetical protein
MISHNSLSGPCPSAWHWLSVGTRKGVAGRSRGAVAKATQAVCVAARPVEPSGVLSYAHTLSVECRGCACNYVGDGSEADDERCREQYRAASVWLLNRISRCVTAKLGALSPNDQSNPQTVIPEGMFDAQLRTPITGIRKCDCTGVPAIGITGSIQQRM